MEEIIKYLAELFETRRQIDDQIMAVINHQKQKQEQTENPAPTKKQKRRGRKKKEKMIAEKDPFPKYKCEDCGHTYFSDDDYLDVRCPECSSKKALKLP